MVAVTNIANDLYAKDISKKISSSKQEAMEKGIPTGNVAYGYKVVFNENKVKVMVEDKEAADVVRWIFNEAEKGTLHSVIAAELNAKHILNVHEFVWNKSRYNKVEIDVQGIKLEDKKICELKEIDRVFLYKGFFFLITNEKKLLVLKTVGVETEELIKIIKEADILFEKREEPFNIYEYCKK